MWRVSQPRAQGKALGLSPRLRCPALLTPADTLRGSGQEHEELLRGGDSGLSLLDLSPSHLTYGTGGPALRWKRGDDSTTAQAWAHTLPGARGF